MYPHTRVDIIDQSQIPAITTTQDPKPLYLTAFSSDKGPEDMRLVERDEYFRLYGRPNFDKHGQVSIQNALIMEQDGRLLAKRVVAADSKLAHVAVLAEVTEEVIGVKVEKFDPNGNVLFDLSETFQITDSDERWNDTLPEINGEFDEDSNQLYELVITEEVTRFDSRWNDSLPRSLERDENGLTVEVDETIFTVKYITKTITEQFIEGTNVSIEVLMEKLAHTISKEKNTTNGVVKVYPLFIIADNGRGLSNKKFRITPDYAGSRNVNFLQYKMDVIEGSQVSESLMFALDRNKELLGRPFSLLIVTNNNSSQVRAYVFEENIEELYGYMEKKIESDKFINIAKDVKFIDNDLLFGYTKNDVKISNIVIDPEGAELSKPSGIPLEGGSDGSFATDDGVVVNTTEYTNSMVSFFNGSFTDDIYDLDRFKIDAVFDANYPSEVKRAIFALCEFRKDFFYFRDYGMVKGYNDIVYQNQVNQTYRDEKGIYVADYHANYMIRDPYTRRQIRVTMLLELAELSVAHFNNNRNRPLAGMINGMVLNRVIPGTENFIPKQTPTLSQKESFDDMKVNYAGWYEDQLVIESQLTSQDTHTQLSYISNILAIQEVVKAIRTQCPKSRYSFIDGDDLTIYSKEVTRLLRRYRQNFNLLEFEYIEDDLMVQNKVYYAAIRVIFKDYVRAEWFKIFAISNDSTS